MDPTGKPDPVSRRRRQALRSMLEAAEARHARAVRRRLPPLAAGVQVRIVDGPHALCTGVILDADYIQNRVLLRLTPADRDGHGDRADTQWINFANLGPIAEE